MHPVPSRPIAPADHGNPWLSNGLTIGRFSIIRMIETLAALMLAAMILLLSASVFFRYVLNSPLIWSDELAEILIIWQAMLGAVIALERHQHLRLSTVTQAMPQTLRQGCEILCLFLVLLFTVPLTVYATGHAVSDLDIVTPALGISAAWRSSAIAVCLVLLSLVAIAQLLKLVRGRVPETASAVAVIAVAVGLLYAFSDVLIDIDTYNLIVFFVAIGGACILIGLPIAFAFGIATLAYVVFTEAAPPGIIVIRMETGMAHIMLLAVPVFIVLGYALEIAGMARSLIAFIGTFVGHLKGGMSYVLVGAMTVVSGISGSKAADMGAIAPALLPEMRKRGSKDSELVALLAASSAMSETIPPSLVLIMTGAVMGVSIGALFDAGWMPALVLAVLLCVVARIRSSGEDLSHVQRATWKMSLDLGIKALPVLALPFLIRGAVVGGVATATEVATIGIVYILAVTLLMTRTFGWSRLFQSLKDASVLTGSIFIILATANAMAWALIQSGLSGTLLDLAENLPGGGATFLALSVVIFIVFGSILEGIPAVVLLGPLLFPIASNLGISEVHYTIVAVLSMGVGLFAPPFGVGYYTACAIAKVDPNEGVRTIWPYLGVIAVGVLVIALFPALTVGG